MLSYFNRHNSKYRIDGDLIYLRPACKWDCKQWVSLREVSRNFLTPWEPEWGKDGATKSSFKRRLTQAQLNWVNGSGYGFFIFNSSTDQLLGGITMANIRYGVVQSASIGYWIGAPYVKKGYMSEAISLILEFSFMQLNLHRVEAGCIIENHPSRNLLLKNGFHEEGIAREYLRINGRWQDHMKYAILKSDFLSLLSKPMIKFSNN